MTSSGEAWGRPVARQGPLRDSVRAELEDLIFHGILEPGEHLREDVVAERLGVSRQPIREALQMLAQDQFVDLVPGRGAFVHVPTRDEVDDLFDVRAILEAETARRAALRATPQVLDELHQLCVTGSEAVQSNDKRTLIDLNRAFHSLIHTASGNAVMLDMLLNVEKRINTHLASIISARAPDSWKQHEQIYLALKERDANRASTLMSEHVNHTRQLLGDKYGKPPIGE
jgi:DNA-binding GntR family transcriptional regulator